MGRGDDARVVEHFCKNRQREKIATVMYVLQGMPRTPGPITDVFSGVMPFVGVYMLAVLILLLFPGLALVLVPH